MYTSRYHWFRTYSRVYAWVYVPSVFVRATHLDFRSMRTIGSESDAAPYDRYVKYAFDFLLHEIKNRE